MHIGREVQLYIEFLSLSKFQPSSCREYLPDDWDLQSTASLNSELRRLDDNIKTISEIISNEKEVLYDIEPRPPSRLVTCIFSTCYFTLGKTGDIQAISSQKCISSPVERLKLQKKLLINVEKLQLQVYG